MAQKSQPWYEYVFRVQKRIFFIGNSCGLDLINLSLCLEMELAFLHKRITKQGKMIAPPGTVDDFNKYLELQPTGPYAEGAKQMLDTLGAKVTTGFKKK